MNVADATKKIINRLIIILLILFVFILISFFVHIYRVNQYNSLDRKLTPESTITEVAVDLHPRGQATDSWEKDNAFPDKIIYAKIYEGTITNTSGFLLKDWELTVNIKDDCFLNNAWCGKVEIHQHEGTKENVQTIDLRDYKEEDVTLEHIMAGQDLLIPLKKGDYIIYHPDTGISGEMPLESDENFDGVVNIGLIMYSYEDDVDLSEYSFDYHLKQSYLEGSVGKIFLILFGVWILAFAFWAVISGLVLRFQSKLNMQSQKLKETFEIIATLADGKDSYTAGHSKRVAKYSRIIAEEMGMDKADCDNIYEVAMLHNIGNYYVSGQILSKPTTLSSEEYSIVKNHTAKGANLLENMYSLPYVLEGTLLHHERYDGTGYPTGRKGDEIPLIARIIAVADAFDSMNSDRTYRKKLTMEQIRKEFEDKRGSQFDPLVVDVVLEILEELEGYEQV